MKNKYFIFIPVSLMTLLIMYLLIGRYTYTTTTYAGKYFTIRDTTLIHWIRIEGTGDVLLNKKNEVWMLYDTLSADPVTVSNFLFVFNRLNIKGIVDQASDTVKDQLLTISYGDKKGEKTMRYYKIHEMDVLQKGNSGRPFFAEVAGFPDIRISDVVSDDPYFWRNHLLVSLKPQDIKWIRLHYPSAPEKDFTLYNYIDSLILYDPVENFFYTWDKLNKEKLRMFTSYFMQIYFEDFITETHQRDSVLNSTPEMQIILADRNDTQVIMDIMPVYRGNRKSDAYIFIRKNNRDEIMTCKHILTDLWSKGKEDLILN